MLLFNLSYSTFALIKLDFNTSNVTIQPFSLCIADILCYYFNTSNVTIQQIEYAFKILKLKISIHLMLLFN